MESVKTYHQVNKRDKNAHFSIAKMKTIYTKLAGKSDAPHRHDFYTIIIVKKAKGFHKIDFQKYTLKKSQLFFVAPGQVHQMIEEIPSDGYALTFSSDFLMENYIPISFIESLNLFNDYGQSPPLEPSSTAFEKIYAFARNIYEIDSSDAKLKYFSIGAYLKLLLIACNNSCNLSPQEIKNETAENKILKAFKQAVNIYYQKEHSTSFYANLVNITPDHLNRTIKNTIGKTAKEYIQSKIITEAKRLLYFSEQSHKEIAFELGFSEPANFSAFFKKCTKTTPSNFVQKEVKK